MTNILLSVSSLLERVACFVNELTRAFFLKHPNSVQVQYSNDSVGVNTRVEWHVQRESSDDETVVEQQHRVTVGG